MPQSKEVHKDYMKERRAKEASQFPNQLVNEHTVIRDGVEMPRYVTLSDGQVMDRAYKPEVKPLTGSFIQAMRASNRADSEFKPNQGDRRALASIINKTTQPPSTSKKKEEQG